jgi:Acetyl-coA carboxylase zinc finger domain
MTAVEAPADWLACQDCGALLFHDRFERLLGVCPECGRHRRMTAGARLELLLDEGAIKPARLPDTVHDPLRFNDLAPYAQRLANARERTQLSDAVLVAHGLMAAAGLPVLAGSGDPVQSVLSEVLADPDFLAGSYNHVLAHRDGPKPTGPAGRLTLGRDRPVPNRRSPDGRTNLRLATQGDCHRRRYRRTLPGPRVTPSRNSGCRVRT